MNLKNILPKVLPHTIAVVLFVIISLAYMSPVMKGKNLRQHDVIQSLGAAHQSQEYYKKTGDFPFWNPYMFSGMPNYMIYMDYPSSISVHLGRMLVNLLPEPANLLFLYMLGAYVGLCLMGFSPWLSFLGAVSFAFTSYNIINIDAGHISKCLSVAFIPPIIGAVWQVYRGKYILGGILLMFFSAIHQYANFVQMTYYLGLTLLIFALVEFIIAIIQNNLKHFVIASAVAIIAGVLSMSNHINRYMVVNEYVKNTTRGKNELSDSPENVVLGASAKKSKTQNNAGGLDKEYAFRWSYGIGETLNFLIPNAYGGSSFETPAENSKLMEALQEEASKYNLQAENLFNYLLSQGALPAMYWGEQPGTGGPAYMGAVLLMLFVWSMLISKNPLKWWVLGAVLLCVSIAWGKNFFLNDFFFDYLPLFNKFRAVTMILSFMPIFLVIGAALGLQETQNILQENPDIFWKKLRVFAIFFAGTLLIFAMAGGLFFDFRSTQDRMLIKEGGEMADLFKNLVRAAQYDRLSLFKADAWRSFVFVMLALLALWALWKKYIKFEIAIAVISLLSLIDLLGVAKRFLNNEKFVEKEEARTLEPSPTDESILKDTSYYRVLNLGNPFNDASTSYFHHSAGGYHGAKLRIYQDIISGHLDKEIQALYKNLQDSAGKLTQGSTYKPVIDMLNIKYFIVPLQGGKSIAIQNPDALGAAWIVPEYKLVENADEELKALKNLNIRKMAVLRKQKGTDNLSSVQWDSLAKIRLTKHSPNEMVYEFEAKAPQLVLFSEIYYRMGESGWQAYLDGKPAEYFKANYALRGMVVPAGKHTITFRFEAKVYQDGEKLALISSILMVLLLLGGGFYLWKKSKPKIDAES
ncbi:hypothetical protein [Raineya sp.]|jgi:hypothetical protein